MIYARAHDQTVAEDYFSAMQRIEERLDIEPKEEKAKDVKVQEQLLFFVEQLSQPEIGILERLSIAEQLRQLFGVEPLYSSP
jgi:hypothetical protein